MTYFVTRNRGGWHWLCAIANGRIYWLHRQARIGECFRLRQKFKGTLK